MKKENLLRIFRLLYLMWTFIYIVTILTHIFNPISRAESLELGYQPHAIDYINAIFLIFGVYHIFKYFSKE